MDTTESTGDAVAENLPLLLTADGAARFCGTGLRTWRSWDSAGHIPRAVHIGRSVFWRRDELREWVQAGCPSREYWNAREENSARA